MTVQLRYAELDNQQLQRSKGNNNKKLGRVRLPCLCC